MTRQQDERSTVELQAVVLDDPEFLREIVQAALQRFLDTEITVQVGGVGHSCGSSDVGDIVRRTGTRALQGLESGCRDADHGVAPGQPDAAGRLTPERLGFDDLTKLPVVRAVVPCTLCDTRHHLGYPD